MQTTRHSTKHDGSKLAEQQIGDKVENEISTGLLWPEPLHQLNPSFEPSATIEQLVVDGILHVECERTFRVKRHDTVFRAPFRLPLPPGSGGSLRGEGTLLRLDDLHEIRARAAPVSFLLLMMCCGLDKIAALDLTDAFAPYRGAWPNGKETAMFRSAILFIGILAVAAAQDVTHSQEKKPLIVAAVSCETKIRDPKQNLERIAYWSKRAADRGAHLVLFPECTIHGWWQSRENRRFAETINGESLSTVREIARKYGLLIAAGITEKCRGKYYITHAIVGPDGVIGYHRKSSLAGGEKGEASVWDKGNDANVFDVRGYKVGIAICFESVHPQTCRDLKSAGAELILAPYANGTRPEEILDPKRTQRKWIWDRVRENRVWYLACDATPHDKEGRLLPGAAFAISPTGQLAACTAKDNPGESMVVVRIDEPALKPVK